MIDIIIALCVLATIWAGHYPIRRSVEHNRRVRVERYSRRS